MGRSTSKFLYCRSTQVDPIGTHVPQPHRPGSGGPFYVQMAFPGQEAERQMFPGYPGLAWAVLRPTCTS